MNFRRNRAKRFRQNGKAARPFFSGRACPFIGKKMESEKYFSVEAPSECPLKPEASAFLEKFPKRGGELIARAISGAANGNSRMLNLIRSQRIANSEKISGAEFFEESAPLRGGGRMRVRVYNSGARNPKPAVIYLHGGGWTIGAIETCAKVCSDLARNFAVIAPEYRLSPEFPHPAALHDVLDALAWARENSGRLGIAGGKISLCGDSAGGHLAIAAAAAAKSEGLPPPEKLALFYPVTSMFYRGESWEKFAGGFALDAEAMDAFNLSYCADAEKRKSAEVSPLEFADVSGFPPTLIVYASHDILRDQCFKFAEKLAASGIPARAVCAKGAPHIFMTMPGMGECYSFGLGEAREFLGRE